MPEGLIVHFASPTEIGYRATEVWQSAEHRKRFRTGVLTLLLQRLAGQDVRYAETELDCFPRDPGRLLNVDNGIDVEVEKNVEDRHITSDQCDVVRLNDGEATAAIYPSKELQEVTALSCCLASANA
jgi:hypothetical protein